MDKHEWESVDAHILKTDGGAALIGIAFAGLIGFGIYTLAKSVNHEEPLTTIQNNLKDLLTSK